MYYYLVESVVFAFLMLQAAHDAFVELYRRSLTTAKINLSSKLNKI